MNTHILTITKVDGNTMPTTLNRVVGREKPECEAQQRYIVNDVSAFFIPAIFYDGLRGALFGAAGLLVFRFLTPKRPVALRV